MTIQGARKRNSFRRLPSRGNRLSRVSARTLVSVDGVDFTALRSGRLVRPNVQVLLPLPGDDLPKNVVEPEAGLVADRLANTRQVRDAGANVLETRSVGLG